MTDWIEQPAPYDDSKSLQENKRRSRGVVRCHCGEAVSLDNAVYPPHYAAGCGCGQLFNLSGQQLVPESEWEDGDDE